MAGQHLSPLGSLSAPENEFLRRVLRALKIMAQDRSALFYLSIIVFVFLLGLLGPTIAPYPHDETMTQNGKPLLTEGPSVQHPLGTTDQGYDVLSRVLVGAQPTTIAGLIGGTMIIGIGGTIGLTAGYVGGRVENVLMRITDVVYGVPLLPFAIVMVTFIGVGFFKALLIIGLVLWRANARVIRSQVLQIKERPYILAAKTTGASTITIMTKHILPNVAPMAILFFATGTGQTILLQAGLAFLGITSPFVPSWGVMVRNAYKSGQMAEAWWWSLPPGLLISLTVLSLYMFGRRYEILITEQESEEALIG